jgi:hypothetical protein
VPDGVFVRDAGDPEARPRFHRLPPPTDEEVADVLDKVAGRVDALLRAHGRLVDPGAPELAVEPEPIAASLADAISVPKPASRTVAPIALYPEPLSVRQDGYSLHAARVVHENDRQGLEALCRYGLRPAIAHERLSLGADGLVRYRLKRTFSDGTNEIVLSPEQLLRRLCALVPPPRVHLVKYHGVFAPAARGRAALTGQKRSPPPRLPGGASPAKGQAASEAASPHPDSSPVAASSLPAAAEPGGPGGADSWLPMLPDQPRRPARLPWAELLRRVYRQDVLACVCGGRLRVLAFLTDPSVIRAILLHLGLPAMPPPIAPARGPPQAEMDFGGWSDEDFVDPPAPD